MNVVDSSAWLEYFAGGPNASFFAAAIEDQKRLIIPSVCLYEVFKTILRQLGKKEALEKAAAMRQGKTVAGKRKRPAPMTGRALFVMEHQRFFSAGAAGGRGSLP